MFLLPLQPLPGAPSVQSPESSGLLDIGTGFRDMLQSAQQQIDADGASDLPMPERPLLAALIADLADGASSSDGGDTPKQIVSVLVPEVHRQVPTEQAFSQGAIIPTALEDDAVLPDGEGLFIQMTDLSPADSEGSESVSLTGAPILLSSGEDGEQTENQVILKPILSEDAPVSTHNDSNTKSSGQGVIPLGKDTFEQAVLEDAEEGDTIPRFVVSDAKQSLSIQGEDLVQEADDSNDETVVMPVEGDQEDGTQKRVSGDGVAQVVDSNFRNTDWVGQSGEGETARENDPVGMQSGGTNEVQPNASGWVDSSMTRQEERANQSASAQAGSFTRRQNDAGAAAPHKTDFVESTQESPLSMVREQSVSGETDGTVNNTAIRSGAAQVGQMMPEQKVDDSNSDVRPNLSGEQAERQISQPLTKPQAQTNQVPVVPAAMTSSDTPPAPTSRMTSQSDVVGTRGHLETPVTPMPETNSETSETRQSNNMSQGQAAQQEAPVRGQNGIPSGFGMNTAPSEDLPADVQSGAPNGQSVLQQDNASPEALRSSPRPHLQADSQQRSPSAPSVNSSEVLQAGQVASGQRESSNPDGPSANTSSTLGVEQVTSRQAEMRPVPIPDGVAAQDVRVLNTRVAQSHSQVVQQGEGENNQLETPAKSATVSANSPLQTQQASPENNSDVVPQIDIPTNGESEVSHRSQPVLDRLGNGQVQQAGRQESGPEQDEVLTPQMVAAQNAPPQDAPRVSQAQVVSQDRTHRVGERQQDISMAVDGRDEQVFVAADAQTDGNATQDQDDSRPSFVMLEQNNEAVEPRSSTAFGDAVDAEAGLPPMDRTVDMDTQSIERIPGRPEMRVDTLASTSRAASTTDVSQSQLDAMPPEQIDRTYRVGEQVIRSARVMTREGATEVTMRLDPKELGEVSIRLSTHEQVVSGEITVENHKVQEIVQRNLGALREALASQGIQLDQIDVSVNDRGAQPDRETFREGLEDRSREQEQQGQSRSESRWEQAEKQQKQSADGRVDFVA